MFAIETQHPNGRRTVSSTSFDSHDAALAVVERLRAKPRDADSEGRLYAVVELAAKRHVGDAEEFYTRASRHWRNVTFDPKTGRGSVPWPHLVTVEFWESANDAAVCVRFGGGLYMKGRAADVYRALDKISKIIGNVGG